MGWCSGTDIYAPVARELLESTVDDSTKEHLLAVLISALQDRDWDCEELVTSDPIELKVFKRLGLWSQYEEWYE